MIAVITMFWWIGLAFITMYGLVLEFGLVSEFVNPILTWILVMVFGIPFMPILPVFAYMVHGTDAAIHVTIFLVVSTIYYMGGSFLLSMYDNRY